MSKGDWVSFEGRVAPVDWRRSTFAVLRLPDGGATALTEAGAARAAPRARRIDARLASPAEAAP